ncbi:MAG: hypothetical protein ABIG44_03565 [Planctomycetota bacterium]
MTAFWTSTVALLGSAAVVPSPDPLGYPVPAWLIRALVYLTLTLHLSAVHFTVGGALLLLWALLRKRDGYEGTARFLGAGLPLGVSYLITLGIPPLLFVQVLYGQFFYTSSVVIGAFWIQVIPAVILAYAGFYYCKFKRDLRPGRRLVVIAACTLLLLYVGFIYVNNFTLATSPEKWMELYAGAPGGGYLVHGDRTIHPRLTLFLAGAFSVAGLTLIWRGTYLEKWGSVEAGRAARGFGFRALIVTPVLWVAGAAGWYAVRPDDIRAVFSGMLAGWLLLGLWIAGGLVMIVCAYRARHSARLVFPLVASLGMFAATACMVVLRDLHRIALLAPSWDSSMVDVRAQWGMFTLFVVFLAVGLALVIGLLIKSLPGMAAAARARAQTRQAPKSEL